MTTYCINPYTGATTEYENFNFLSLCQAHDGNYYGVTSAGIFKLGGNYDVDQPIGAMIGLGRTDFGSIFMKNLSFQYAAASSETPLLSRVITDSMDYSYESQVRQEGVHMEKFILGKGLRSVYFGFELYNTCGGAFELISLTTLASPSKTRRI